MNKNQKKIFCAVVMNIILFSFSSLSFSIRMNNTPIKYPDSPLETSDYRYIEKRPDVKLTGDGKATLTFNTMKPTPPVTLYYGLPIPDQELDYPRYRQSASEEGTEYRTEHSVTFDIPVMERVLRNHKPTGIVDYRIEIFVPDWKQARFYEGRFNYIPGSYQQAVSIIEGPVVANITENSAIIAWDTDSTSDGVVNINGTDLKFSKSKNRHEVLIDELKPNTQYEYYVKCDGATSLKYSFRTAPKSGQSFTFAAMSDSRGAYGGGEYNYNATNYYTLRDLGVSAYRNGAELFLFFGDLVSGHVTSTEGFRQQLKAFKHTLAPVNRYVPIYTGIGNHELLMNLYRVDGRQIRMDKPSPESTEDIFGEEFVNPTNGPENEGPETPTMKENVYYVDYGNCRFIILNNNYWFCSDPVKFGGLPEGGMLDNQLNWLKNVIQDADKNKNIKHIFAGAQEPVFPNGGHSGDAMWYRGGDTNRDSKVDENDLNIIETRNELWEILSSSPKMVAFIVGDEHNYCRMYIDNKTNVGHKKNREGKDVTFKYPVWHLTSGGAGAPFYDQEKNLPWSENVQKFSTQSHYLLINVTPKSLTMKAISETGQLLETVDLTNIPKSK